MQWLNSLVSEYEGRPLQKTGMLTKDQLTKFFHESAKQFNSSEFKQLLSISHKTRGPGGAEDVVNGMQKEIFESMGIQGDFGINFLSQVGRVYASDAFFLRQFYQHVQMEEMVLDEAEMPEQLFRAKYDQLNKFRSDMEARIQKLQGMTPEEQAAYMSNIYKEMIAQGTEGDGCSHPDGCSHNPPGGVQAPPGQSVPRGGAAAGGSSVGAAVPAGGGPGGPSALTEAEQLAFFANLSGGSGSGGK